jgi:hypothetical protein
MAERGEAPSDKERTFTAKSYQALGSGALKRSIDRPILQRVPFVQRAPR